MCVCSQRVCPLCLSLTLLISFQAAIGRVWWAVGVRGGEWRWGFESVRQRRCQTDGDKWELFSIVWRTFTAPHTHRHTPCLLPLCARALTRSLNERSNTVVFFSFSSCLCAQGYSIQQYSTLVACFLCSPNIAGLRDKLQIAGWSFWQLE